MTAPEVVTVVISVFSLVVAIYAAVKTKALSEQQLRIGNRNAFQTMLFEIKREMLSEPILYSIYDDHPSAAMKRDELAENVKREALVWLFFRLFELVFAHHGTGQDSATEKESHRCWSVFCVNFFRRSSLAREMWGRPGIRDEFNVHFIKVAEQAIKTCSTSPGMSLTSSGTVK